MATMGERIRQAREELGLTTERLAELVKKAGGDITANGINQLELRSSRKSQASREIAIALGVNHDWLLTGKGPKNPLLSLDAKLELLPADEMEEVYDDVSAIIERRLEKHRVRQ